MNKVLDPKVEPAMTPTEEALMVARAKEGLEDIAAGRTMSLQEARAQMQAHVAKTTGSK